MDKPEKMPIMRQRTIADTHHPGRDLREAKAARRQTQPATGAGAA